MDKTKTVSEEARKAATKLVGTFEDDCLPETVDFFAAIIQSAIDAAVAEEEADWKETLGAEKSAYEAKLKKERALADWLARALGDIHRSKEWKGVAPAAWLECDAQVLREYEATRA